MASLYKRGKYWWVDLTPREKKLLGKNSFSTKKTNRIDANKILTNTKEKIRSSIFDVDATTDLNSMKFSQAIDLFYADRKNTGQELSPGTVGLYEKALKYFYTSVGDKEISSYTRNDYHLFVAAMDTLGQNTKAMFTARIYAIFNWLKKEGYIRLNPMRIVKEIVRPINIPSDEKINELLEYSKETKFYYFIKFMLLSGFRVSEALNLKFSDIQKDQIKVIGKGNKHASIPIINSMRILLDELPPSDNDKVFTFNYMAVRKFIYRAEKQIGLRIKSHDLRKYCISKLANSGVNVFFVKNYARHSDVKTTLKYYAAADSSALAKEINEKVTFKF